MKNAADIIEALGGSAAVSRNTGFPLTTIESWKSANFIPDWRWPKLLKLAKKLGEPLSEADFPERKRKAAA